MAIGAEFMAPVQKLACLPSLTCFHKDAIEFFKSEMESWEPHLEYGFPCPDRRMKSYFVQEEKLFYEASSRYTHAASGRYTHRGSSRDCVVQ